MRSCSFEGVGYACSRCGSCCRTGEGPGVTPKDYRRIRDNLRISNFAETRTNPILPYKLKVSGKACIFLKGENKCTVYNFRPLLCRLYPFYPHIKWNGQVIWCVEHCPGMSNPKRRPIDDRCQREFCKEIVELEGQRFLSKLRRFTLSIKKPTTPIFGECDVFLYGDWLAKERALSIVWKMFLSKTVSALTPRERLECLHYDVLPFFLGMVRQRMLCEPPSRSFHLNENCLVKAYDEFRKFLPDLLQRSRNIETVHRKLLADKGILVYRAANGNIAKCSRDDRVTILKRTGDGTQVKVDDIMHSLPFSNRATREEVKYIRELIRREGRYGKETIDLPVNEIVYLLFRVADIVELKANAFAIRHHGSKIGSRDMQAAICAVERVLAGLVRELYLNDPIDVISPQELKTKLA